MCHSRARWHREKVTLACFLNWWLTCTMLFPQHWNLLKVTLARLSFCHERLDQMILEVLPTWDSMIQQSSLHPSIEIIGNPISSFCLGVYTTTNSSKGKENPIPNIFYSTASFHPSIPKCFANTELLSPDVPMRFQGLSLLLEHSALQ